MELGVDGLDGKNGRKFRSPCHCSAVKARLQARPAVPNAKDALPMRPTHVPGRDEAIGPRTNQRFALAGSKRAGAPEKVDSLEQTRLTRGICSVDQVTACAEHQVRSLNAPDIFKLKPFECHPALA